MVEEEYGEFGHVECIPCDVAKYFTALLRARLSTANDGFLWKPITQLRLHRIQGNSYEREANLAVSSSSPKPSSRSVGHYLPNWRPSGQKSAGSASVMYFWAPQRQFLGTHFIGCDSSLGTRQGQERLRHGQIPGLGRAGHGGSLDSGTGLFPKDERQGSRDSQEGRIWG